MNSVGQEDPTREVNAIISRALRESKSTKRHPAEVTSDRLGDAVTRWGNLLTGAEKDMIARVRQALEEIADGTKETQQ